MRLHIYPCRAELIIKLLELTKSLIPHENFYNFGSAICGTDRGIGCGRRQWHAPHHFKVTSRIVSTPVGTAGNVMVTPLPVAV